eukprot:TRINITY_DN9560_c0_g1_i1.p1 TRINITY_DN9560_c0_g1~~TRINITY_DN9560_c0_g1_i1.p1  ORF type:complete len:226 (+),score=49.05 TRINITY_DN9560_c0_g1_i1:168-845(+)
MMRVKRPHQFFQRQLDSVRVALVAYHALWLLMLLFALTLLPPVIEDTRNLLCGECECECPLPSPSTDPATTTMSNPPLSPSEAEKGQVVEGEFELFGTPILTFSYTTSSSDKNDTAEEEKLASPRDPDPYMEEIARERNERLRADAIRDTIRRCQEAFRAMCKEIPAQVNMLGEAAKASRKVVDRTFKHGEFKKWLYPGAAFGVMFAVLDEAFATLAQNAGRLVC